MMPDAATLRTDGSGTPQRLDKVMAILHHRLLFDEEVQDYHFIVDSADHHHILRDGFPQLVRLNDLLRGNVKSVSVYRSESLKFQR